MGSITFGEWLALFLLATLTLLAMTIASVLAIVEDDENL
jgi:hypothetical protein